MMASTESTVVSSALTCRPHAMPTLSTACLNQCPRPRAPLCRLRLSLGQRSLQVVLNDATEGIDLLRSGRVTLGAAIGISGVVVASQGGKQAVEIQASSLSVVSGGAL